MILPHLFGIANAPVTIGNIPVIAALPHAESDNIMMVRAATWTGLVLLLSLALFVYNFLPKRHRQIEKFLLIAGFAGVAPMLSVVWTGHAKNIDDWSDTTKNILIGSFAIGTLLVITGGAFFYVRHRMEVIKSRRLALEARAARDADRSVGFPVIIGTPPVDPTGDARPPAAE